MLQASHKLPDFPYADEPLDSPEAFQRLKESSDAIYRARIATIYPSEAQAQRILDDVWPGQSLLGAKCGRGFSIDTAEQAAIINRILAPDVSIFFGQDHKWMLQTWSEVEGSNKTTGNQDVLHGLLEKMKPQDEKELRRLTDMLREIDATLERDSPLREGLKKAGLALICAFINDLRPEIEQQFKSLGTLLTETERARFKRMGIDPDS